MTLVAASAGSGKSTALREYLALRRVDHVRFTCNAAHAAAGEFLRGFARALSGAAPAMTSSAAAMAARLGQPGGELAVLGWAREHLASLETTIVLDDLHHALGDPRTVGFLSALVDATVPRLRWMLAARDATALPVPRWLADSVIALPLDDDDLRVTFEELRASARAARLELDDAVLRELEERTGGWPLGLAVSLTHGGSSFAGREQTYDGVVEAALAPLPERDRERLVELALVGTFDGALALRLGYGSRDVEALLASGLAYAVDDGSYAFYDAYRERLGRHAGQVGAERRSALFERVASALDQAGRWTEAVELRIDAADGERLARALEARGFEALDQGNVALVDRALAALPDATLAVHPRALCMKAALASLEERFDVSEAWFRMAVDAAGNPADRREIVIRYGVDLVRRGRTDVLELLEAEAKREQSRSSADASLWGLLGTAYVEAHRLDEARDAARRALQNLGAVEDDGLRARICHQAAYVALNDGDYASARELAERALESAERGYFYDVAARILSVLFNIAILHDDDVPAGRRALAKLEEAGRKAGSTTLRIYALLNAYSIEVDAGDVAAIERLDAALRELEVHLTPTASEALLPAQALRAAWDGRFEHAYELLAHGVEKLFDEDRMAYRWAEIAVYAAAAGKRRESSAAIRRSRELVRRVDPNQQLVLRARAYLAIAEILLAHDGRARSAIADVRAAARRSGPRLAALVEAIRALHVRWTTGWHDATALGDALDALAGVDLGGVARFIGALPLPTSEGARLRLLTETELKVLGLVAAGATSKEIAVELERSSQTVDVHIRSICKKLGCSGRRQAVALALRDGLIGERRHALR